MKLEISQRTLGEDGAIAVIALAGRLMLGPGGAEFEAMANRLYDGGTGRKVIVDLGGVTHIDSTGIGRCISVLNKAMKTGGQLHMAGAKGQVRDSFRVTRLDRMFRFFETVEEAQAAFKA